MHFKMNTFISTLSVVILLILWKIASIFANSQLLLPPPEKVLFDVLNIISGTTFLPIMGSTLIRGLSGFLLAFFFSLIIGMWMGISHKANAFFKPALVVLRSTPIISFILLALIWLENGKVAVFIAFLSMFPLLSINIADGIRTIDAKLLEMSKIYCFSKRKTFRHVYLPGILPFMFNGASNAMGIGWRAVVIGEVLSQPRWGIGTMMQQAHIYLNVSEVLAWTIIIILIGYLFERLIRLIENKLLIWKTTKA
jgi:NitT/TauT family transport system permease protein